MNTLHHGIGSFLLTAIAISSLGGTALAQSSDWDRFRGPGGLGVSADKSPPLKWSQQEGIVWKTPLPGPGTSSPVVVGGRIFLTSYSGFGTREARGGMDDLRLHLLALDRADGKILWNTTLQPSLPEQATIREGHGYASSTPVVDAQRIYAFFGKSGVYAFDHAGKQLWRADVGTKLSGWGSAASPVIFKDSVIINASVESESLVALDSKTGKEVWRAGGIKESWNTPILVDAGEGKIELVVAIMGKIMGLDPASGEVLWSCKTDIQWYMVPSLVAEQGIVYCVGGRSGGSLAVRTGGRGDVTASHRLWTGKKGSNVTSPILHAGNLYWMHENIGIAYCADAKTGVIVYEQRIEGAGQVYACPVLADGKLYYTTRQGTTFVLAAKPAYELLATNDLRDRTAFNSSPAVAAGRIFLRSDGFLYCLGRK